MQTVFKKSEVVMKKGLMKRKTVYVHEETWQKAMIYLNERDLTVSKYIQLCLAEFVDSIEGQPSKKPVGDMTVDEFLEVTKYWWGKLDEENSLNT